MRGAYLLFTMVITALAAISAACGSLIDAEAWSVCDGEPRRFGPR